MAYMPPGSYCKLCLMADPKKCEDCEFEEDWDQEDEDFEEGEEEEFE